MPMSPLQHNSSAAVAASEASKSGGGKPATSADSGEHLSGQEFSSQERALLLCLAHDSISSALQHREISLDPPTPHLAEPRGVFTSLYLLRDRAREDQRKEELRGCVGYILPACSVFRAVAETARAAAFSDNRFPPVTPEEAPRLEIELSILSPAKPIRRRRNRSRLPRSAHQLARPPWPAAAPGPGRARLEPQDFSGANLPQSRTSPGRLAKRRDHRSLHSRNLRRKKWSVVSGQ